MECLPPGSPPCSAHRGLEPPGKKLPWQMGKGGLVFTWMENHNTWGRTKKCTTVRMQTTANHARPGVLTGCGARGQGGGGHCLWTPQFTHIPGLPPSPSKTTMGPRRAGVVTVQGMNAAPCQRL